MWSYEVTGLYCKLTPLRAWYGTPDTKALITPEPFRRFDSLTEKKKKKKEGADLYFITPSKW